MSRAFSMSKRKYSSLWRNASSARLRRVISLLTPTNPTGLPLVSFMSVALSSTGSARPSLVIMLYSRLLMTPLSKVSSLATTACARSPGTMRSKALLPSNSPLLSVPYIFRVASLTSTIRPSRSAMTMLSVASLTALERRRSASSARLRSVMSRTMAMTSSSPQATSRAS